MAIGSLRVAAHTHTKRGVAQGKPTLPNANEEVVAVAAIRARLLFLVGLANGSDLEAREMIGGGRHLNRSGRRNENSPRRYAIGEQEEGERVIHPRPQPATHRPASVGHCGGQFSINNDVIANGERTSENQSTKSQQHRTHQTGGQGHTTQAHRARWWVEGA